MKSGNTIEEAFSIFADITRFHCYCCEHITCQQCFDDPGCFYFWTYCRACAPFGCFNHGSRNAGDLTDIVPNISFSLVPCLSQSVHCNGDTDETEPLQGFWDTLYFCANLLKKVRRFCIVSFAIRLRKICALETR